MTGLDAAFDAALLTRIEDAALNASAPPQQRWIDGWLARFSPGKAKRARCVNPVAEGRLPLAERLAACERVLADAGLPLIVRITPFARPAGLDDWLAALGLLRLDDTRTMVATQLTAAPVGIPAGMRLEPAGAEAYAETIGALRGSPAAQRAAHAQRIALSPVPYQGWLLRRGDEMLACGQTVIDGDLVGLYDVFTAPLSRDQGLASALCAVLLARAQAAGARAAYLQVDAANAPARRVYRRLGFVDAYAYHYRAREREGHGEAA